MHHGVQPLTGVDQPCCARQLAQALGTSTYTGRLSLARTPDMQGLMMDVPLTITGIMRHAERSHGDREIVVGHGGPAAPSLYVS